MSSVHILWLYRSVLYAISLFALYIYLNIYRKHLRVHNNVRSSRRKTASPSCPHSSFLTQHLNFLDVSRTGWKCEGVHTTRSERRHRAHTHHEGQGSYVGEDLRVRRGVQRRDRRLGKERIS